jgi:nucleoside phosphorylase
MSGKTTGLVIPTRWEANPLLDHFSFRLSKGLYEAQINGQKVLAIISGVGRKAALEASQKLVAAGAKELVSVGFCGALVPELHVGDVVTDRIATSDTPARTPDERKALTRQANAVAVDMETRAIVEAGTRLGVPIRALRVVSDEFADDLTPLFGKTGNFSALGIAFRLLNPSIWPLARKLKAQSEFAAQRLEDALEKFFQAR